MFLKKNIKGYKVNTKLTMFIYSSAFKDFNLSMYLV